MTTTHIGSVSVTFFAAGICGVVGIAVTGLWPAWVPGEATDPAGAVCLGVVAAEGVEGVDGADGADVEGVTPPPLPAGVCVRTASRSPPLPRPLGRPRGRPLSGVGVEGVVLGVAGVDAAVVRTGGMTEAFADAGVPVGFPATLAGPFEIEIVVLGIGTGVVCTTGFGLRAASAAATLARASSSARLRSSANLLSSACLRSAALRISSSRAFSLFS